MALYKYVILSRSKPGEEEDYIRWYSEQHLADVCRIEGVVSGTLHRVAIQKVYDLDAPQWTLMTIYELAGDDPQRVIDTILAVAGTDAMPLSDALDRSGMIQAVGQEIAAIG
jgi:epsilon-lactone hydrolase